MTREATWTNSDGLVVGFGTRKKVEAGSAKVSVGGQRQQIVVTITGTKLADADVAAQLVHAPVIPAGAILESAKLFVETAFAGATATMDIGTYLASSGAAVNDAGIDAAVAVGSLTDGAIIACDGALLGTELASNQKIGVTYDTAAFTAGKAVLTVEYIVPAAV